jgi:hypothetical protein
MASWRNVGESGGYLSVEGDTAMYRYCEVQRGVQKCQSVRSSACLLKVILQRTDIVRYRGGYRNVRQYGRPPVCWRWYCNIPILLGTERGTEMSGSTAVHLSVEGNTAIYQCCVVQRGVQKCQALRPATSLPYHMLITTGCSETHVHRHIITILQCMLNVNVTVMEECLVNLSTVLDWESLHAKQKTVKRLLFNIHCCLLLY